MVKRRGGKEVGCTREERMGRGGQGREGGGTGKTNSETEIETESWRWVRSEDDGRGDA
jgi:hypothetical protein